LCPFKIIILNLNKKMKKIIDKKMNKNFKMRYLYSIALFLSLLVITIPFYTSSVFAIADSADQNVILKKKTERIGLLLESDLEGITGMATAQDIGDLDAGEACIEKNKQTHFLVEMLENDIVKVIEQILRVIHAVNSLWTAVKAILLSVAAILQSNYITAAAGTAIQEKVTVVDTSSLMWFINMVLGCVWADLCSFNIGGFPVAIDTSNNIYAAVLCLCPADVLFNMRRLKLIYQTYNCCVEQACTNGMSTTACERQLTEQTCMYFGIGALVSALVGVIIGILAYILYTHVITPLIAKSIPIAGTLVSLAKLPLEIKNLMAAIERMGEVFSEPDCSSLGFDKLKEDARKEAKYPQEEGVKLKWIDTDDDGILDTQVPSESEGEIGVSQGIEQQEDTIKKEREEADKRREELYAAIEGGNQ